MIADLEHSNNLLERQKYADFLKQAITHFKIGLAHLKTFVRPEEGLDFTYEIEREEKLIEKLKVKLTNYDVYQQNFEPKENITPEAIEDLNKTIIPQEELNLSDIPF